MKNPSKEEKNNNKGSINYCTDQLISSNGRRRRIAYVFIFIVAVSCLLLYKSAFPFQYFSSSSIHASNQTVSQGQKTEKDLEEVLKAASMEDKTVILTTLNEAWAEEGSILDLFLESFRLGKNTSGLIKNLVIITLDEKAYGRCLSIHPHCYPLDISNGRNFSQEAYFMTPTYLEMMWIRIHFLASVLELGFNFVFTDADVMWLQNPFPHFYKDGDFQIACDNFFGNPLDKKNPPNGGFTYVKSNKKTIEFYKFWYNSRQKFPQKHDQDVLNMIKFDPFLDKIGLEMRFLNTALFGGFCEPSRDFNLACTMHANCCFGLEAKIHDLRIVLQDWTNFIRSPPHVQAVSSNFSWRVPQNCSLSAFNPPKSP